MSLDDARKKYREYFNEKIEVYGETPKGADYNGLEAWYIHFEQLVKVIDPTLPFTLSNYDCGYGVLFDFLQAKGWRFE